MGNRRSTCKELPYYCLHVVVDQTVIRSFSGTALLFLFQKRLDPLFVNQSGSQASETYLRAKFRISIFRYETVELGYLCAVLRIRIRDPVPF